MKALTIRQPWASCVASGGKRVENRRWKPYGMLPGDDLAVHAGLEHDAGPPPGSPLAAAVQRACGNRPALILPTGYVLAVVRLTGWHAATDEETLFGPGMCCQPWGWWSGWHWELADARWLERPVPAGGRQKLWDLPADVEARVRDQLAVSA